jgi:hypothetical protein
MDSLCFETAVLSIEDVPEKVPEEIFQCTSCNQEYPRSGFGKTSIRRNRTCKVCGEKSKASHAKQKCSHMIRKYDCKICGIKCSHGVKTYNCKECYFDPEWDKPPCAKCPK